MPVYRPCGSPTLPSHFNDALGYIIPYPSRTIFVSLPLHTRSLILEYAYPVAALELEKEHICSSQHPCPILLPLLSPFMRLSLVCREWRELVQNICKSLTPNIWVPRRAGRYLGGHDLVQGRFRITGSIAIEDYLEVLISEDLKSDNGCKSRPEVVLKVYKGTYWSMSKMFEKEWAVYKELSNITPAPLGFASLIHQGKARWISGQPEAKCEYIALERLGPSLEDLRLLCPGRKFPLKWVLAVALQLLERYELLHKNKFVHNGCKPANTCLPPKGVKNLPIDDPARGRLFLIDFDLAWKAQDTHDSGWASNGIYASRFFYAENAGCSYNTDLEVLSYLLVMLSTGYLPWDHYDRESIYRMSTSAICDGLDPVFSTFMRWARGLVHGEDPEHTYLRSLFAAVWVREGFGSQLGHVDWWEEYDKLSE